MSTSIETKIRKKVLGIINGMSEENLKQMIVELSLGDYEGTKLVNSRHSADSTINMVRSIATEIRKE
jgi:hypothetical protein